MRLSPIQTLEERHDRLLVGALGRGKPTFVHPIVYIIIGPLVRLLDLRFQLVRQQHDILVSLRQQIIKLGIEHPNDLRGLIADDRLLLLVVQGRDREAAFILRVDLEVDVAEELVVGMQGIGCHIVPRNVFSSLFRKAPAQTEKGHS